MIHRAYSNYDPIGQLHYAYAGAGPAIMLIHQTPRSWDEFKEVIELLESKFTLVAIDLPGMGASSAPKSAASIEIYANAVLHLVETLALGPCALCGHHTGGVVALEAAANRPDLFSSLILSSTPWVDDAEIIARASKVPIDTVSKTRDGRHLAALWAQRSPYYPDRPEFMDRFLSDALKARAPEEGHLAVSKHSMEPSVARIRCPVLIIEHSKDPFASKHTPQLAKIFPAAKLETIPEGHIPLEATAGQFADIIDRWASNVSNHPLTNVQA